LQQDISRNVSLKKTENLLTRVYEPLMLNLFITLVKQGKLEVNKRATFSASCAGNHISFSEEALPVFIFALDSKYQLLFQIITKKFVI